MQSMQQMEQMMQQMATMSVEERNKMMQSLPEPQRRMVIQAQIAMADMTHLSNALKPSPEEPDAPISTFTVIKGLSTCPSLKQIDDVTPGDTKVIVDTVDKLASALLEVEALDEAQIETCSQLPASHRRNTLLLFWQMYQQKLEKKITLDEISARQREICNQLATGILVKAQMLLVQNRWIQATLAIARVSALVSCCLWSHTDEAATLAMAKVLESDGLPYPKLRLEATTSAKERAGEKEVLINGVVQLDVVLYRDHVSKPGAKAAIGDSSMNPQGILEAYWCYVEGVKPEADVPNSLIGAQPMIVKALDQHFVSLELGFRAPPTPGTYPVRVHLVSTSVVGVDLVTETNFVVVEDDVPSLE